MIFSKRTIRAHGLDQNTVFHAIEIDPDIWHAVDVERNSGICVYDRTDLITRIADLLSMIYTLNGSSGDSGRQPFMVNIDRAGNIWLHNEYMNPARYLPMLIGTHLGTPDGI